MWEQLCLIIDELESRGQKFTLFYETENGESSFFACWSDIKVSGRVYPVNTIIMIEQLEAGHLGNSEYVTFVTFICEGQYKDSGESFNEAIEKLNYHYFGKLVRDYTDKSQDIMYITSLNSLTLEVVGEHLDHHVEVKGALTPGFERLRDC